MHRLIMLSDTYRASSVADEESLQKDPENHFLSRMNRRRLDGDSIRDTVLAVAGTSESEDGRRGRDSAADERRDISRRACRICGPRIPIRPSTSGAASISR